MVFDPFADAIEWREHLSQRAKAALDRHGCKFKFQVQRLGQGTFVHDPAISKAVLLEIEQAIGTWEPSESAPDDSGPAWNRTNPPKREA
jgi:hypothetical protein